MIREGIVRCGGGGPRRDDGVAPALIYGLARKHA